MIANGHLRRRLLEVCADWKVDLAVPPLSLCTDNGAMVAGLGARRTPGDGSSLTVRPDLPVEMN